MFTTAAVEIEDDTNVVEQLNVSKTSLEKVFSMDNRWVVDIGEKSAVDWPMTSHYRILTHQRYIAVENLVRKGEIAFLAMFSTLYGTYLPF